MGLGELGWGPITSPHYGSLRSPLLLATSWCQHAALKGNQQGPWAWECQWGTAEEGKQEEVRAAEGGWWPFWEEEGKRQVLEV